jgi:hypothetical protein
VLAREAMSTPGGSAAAAAQAPPVAGAVPVPQQAVQHEVCKFVNSRVQSCVTRRPTLLLHSAGLSLYTRSFS